MPRDTDLPILGSVISGWRNAFAAVGSLKLIVGTAFALGLMIAVVYTIIELRWPSTAKEWSFREFSLYLAYVTALTLVQTPMAIAIIRQLLLGETRSEEHTSELQSLAYLV